MSDESRYLDIAEIVADGKSLWKSRDLTQLKSADAPFDVSIRGDRQLMLTATSEQEISAAHVLRKEPQLIRGTADDAKSKAAPRVSQSGRKQKRSAKV